MPRRTTTTLFKRHLTAQAGEYEEEGLSGYATALAELGEDQQKSSCWMWYVFPTLVHPRSSQTARYFALRNVAEARAYLAHPVLGPRWRAAATAALEALASGTAYPEAMFGPLDEAKFYASLALLTQASSPI